MSVTKHSSVTITAMTPVILLYMFWATTAQMRGNESAATSEVECGQDIKSCDECLQQPGFRWCADRPEEFSSTASENNKMSRCSASFANCKKVVDISNSKNTTQGNQIFTSPSNINLKLRKSQPIEISIEYKEPEHYPLDLYVLLDLSQSMKDDKEKLTELGEKLANEMENITKDFRLGFGSFVDKTVQPYAKASLSQEEIKNGVVMTYGFKHHLSLTSDAKTFTERVKMTNVSTKSDGPERSIEALVQAMVCAKEIGWRNASRKLIILATDADYHVASDGRLGGILVPNDLECHLEKDPNGEYTYTWVNKHEYPSIAQLNYISSLTTVNTIFAVTSDKLSVYTKLAKRVSGAVVAMLTENSDNIVDVVKAEYAKITGSVTLQDDKPADISLKYFVKCHTNDYTPGLNCSGIKKGDVVRFKVEIELNHCNLKQYKFNIKPVSILERVEITVDALCTCPCSKKSEFSSRSCNKKGTLIFGSCECQDQYDGDLCECDTTEADSSGDTGNCTPPNSTSTVEECSGRGVCQCRHCQCQPGYSGPFCECNDFNCPGNPVCSGPAQGHCVCGNCQCEPGWTGNKCDCLKSTDICRKSLGDEICSGKGNCICGECVCSLSAKGRHSGRFCEICLECNEAQCTEYSRCAYCAAFGKSPEEGNDCSGCEESQFIVVEELGSNHIGEKDCRFSDVEKCTYRFAYNTKNDKTRVSNILQCPVAPPVSVIAGIAVGLTIVIGLWFLFIWRVHTNVHNKRTLNEIENASRGLVL